MLEKTASARSFGYKLSGPASEEAITAFEARVESPLPRQVAMFYRHHNGLSVAMPAVEIFPVEALNRKEPGMVPFCRLDGVHELSFDVRLRNQADQWTIVNAEFGFKVTLTMASFWSNKIFAWLDMRRPIWRLESHS